MSRTLISRPNVERIIRMVDLDIKITDDSAREKLVTTLMKDIKLSTTGSDNIFMISYDNKDPRLAKDIVQSLLTIFVEGGLEGKNRIQLLHCVLSTSKLLPMRKSWLLPKQH